VTVPRRSPTAAARAQASFGEGLAWGIAVFALFAATAPRMSDTLLLGNDVVPYAAALAGGASEGLFNPHHLLFHLLAAAVAPAVELAGAAPVFAALTAQVILSALGGALATAAVWRATRALAGIGAARILALLFATSIGNWLYGSVGETYLPATAALAWLWSDAIVARSRGAALSAWRIGAWALLACLLRQDSVLALPFIAMVVPWRRALVGLAGAGVVCVVVYALAYVISAPAVPFVAWLRGLAATGLWGATPGTREVLSALVLTVAAHAWAVARVALELVAGRAPGLEALLAAAPLLVFAGALPFVRAKTGVMRLRTLGIALALFAAARFAFFAWWQPTNLEYHAGTLLPLVLLIAVGLAAGGGAPSKARLTLVALGALLGALGNAALLLEPGRAAHAQSRAQIAFAFAGPTGTVVALDAIAHYAHVRARDVATTPRLIDASALASGADLVALEALAVDLEQALQRDERVVLSIDLVTPALIGTAPPHVDSGVLARLAGLAAPRRERDPNGVVWLVVLER